MRCSQSEAQGIPEERDWPAGVLPGHSSRFGGFNASECELQLGGFQEAS